MAEAGGMSPELDALCQETIRLLSPLLEKPKPNAKLLSKPPFRYLHDTVTGVLAQTGFPEGLFTPQELVSDNIKVMPLPFVV